MTKPLWFRITLYDCNGMHLATWNYDEMFPVIPPRFTYPNENNMCPYSIKIDHILSYQYPLPANININMAISDTVNQFVNELILKEKRK